MNTAVVEFDALANAVGAATQNHDLVVGSSGALVLSIVGAVVVSAVGGAVNMHAFPSLGDAQAQAVIAHVIFVLVGQLCQVAVGEAVHLCLLELLFGQHGNRVLGGPGQNCFFLFHQFFHLLNEVGLDAGQLVQLFNGSALAQCLIHDELALGSGLVQHAQQLVFGLAVEVLGKAQTVAAGFQGADGLLEGFLVGLTNGHDFAHGTHLSAQLVLDALELLKGPASELQNNVLAVGNVLVQAAELAVGNLVQGQAGSQHSGNQGDGEAGCLGGQSGRTAGTGIDLDDDVAVVDGVMCPLNVAAADNLNGVNDAVGLFLQAVDGFLSDGLHGGCAERVAGVHAHGVDVLDGAYGDHLALGVADYFEFQLFPAKDAFLNQNFGNRGGSQATSNDGLQLFNVVYQAAAGAAHGVGGTQHAGITQAACDFHGFFNGVGNLGASHVNAQLVHGVFEGLAVFAALDGVNLNANNLHVVLVQHAGFVQGGAQVQARLATQVGQQGIGTLGLDDLGETLNVQRLNVGDVSSAGVGHDGRGVAVYQHNLVAQGAQSLAGLSAGIVEFAGLANDDGARTNDKNFMDVIAFWHMQNPP